MVSKQPTPLFPYEVRVSSDPDVLLEAVARHADRAAYAELYALVAPRVKGFLMRATRGNVTLSDELTQDVFLRVWKRAKSFDSSRGSAMGWIYTIARNARIDHHRRRRPEVVPDDPVLVDPGPAPDDVTHERRRAERLRTAVSALPSNQSHILECAYFEGRTLAEIAEATETPLGTVKSRVRLAMGHLRSALKDQA